MAKEIKLFDLAKWLNENEHRTWSLRMLHDGKKRTFEIKYVTPQLDTRTGNIFRMTVRGLREFIVDFREEFSGNLLELLEHKLEKGITGEPQLWPSLSYEDNGEKVKFPKKDAVKTLRKVRDDIKKEITAKMKGRIK